MNPLELETKRAGPAFGLATHQQQNHGCPWF